MIWETRAGSHFLSPCDTENPKAGPGRGARGCRAEGMCVGDVEPLQDGAASTTKPPASCRLVGPSRAPFPGQGARRAQGRAERGWGGTLGRDTERGSQLTAAPFPGWSLPLLGQQYLDILTSWYCRVQHCCAGAGGDCRIRNDFPGCSSRGPKGRGNRREGRRFRGRAGVQGTSHRPATVAPSSPSSKPGNLRAERK